MKVWQVLALSLLFCGGCPLACYRTSFVKVGDGYRDSTIRKLSETGVVWKTYEVETIGDGFNQTQGDKNNPPALVLETFKYTVRDPAVVDQVKAHPPGKRARLHYTKFLTEWFPRGESRYELTKVESVP